MIDEKKIEEAADIYTDKSIERYEEEKSSECCKTLEQPPSFGEIGEAFKAGINWFKENLWHDASEEPKEGLKLIVEMTNEECHSACRINEWYYISDVNRECEVSVKADSIYRWLYTEDLMKGESNG